MWEVCSVGHNKRTCKATVEVEVDDEMESERSKEMEGMEVDIEPENQVIVYFSLY